MTIRGLVELREDLTRWYGERRAAELVAELIAPPPAVALCPYCRAKVPDRDDVHECPSGAFVFKPFKIERTGPRFAHPPAKEFTAEFQGAWTPPPAEAQ